MIQNGLIYSLIADNISVSSGADIASVPNTVSNATASAAGPTPTMQITNGVKRVHHTPGTGLTLHHDALNGGEITVFMVARRPTGGPVEQVMVQFGDYYAAPNLIGIADFYGEVQAMGKSATKFPSGVSSSTTDALYCLCASVSGFGDLGVGAKMFKNGTMSFRSQGTNGQGLVSDTSILGCLGGIGNGQGGNSFTGDWREFHVYNRALSEAEIATVSAEIAARCALTLQTPEVNFVFDGDSQTTGIAEAEPTALYTDSVLLAQSKPFRAYNIGIYGQGLLQASADGQTQADPLFVAGKKNVMVIWLGTNDLWADSSAGALALSRLKTRCQQARAAGFKVIVIPMMPRADSGQTTYEIARVAFNSAVENDPSFYDARVSVADIPALFAPSAQENTTYFYADKIHLSSFGYRTIAGAVIPLISAIVDDVTPTASPTLSAAYASTQAILSAVAPADNDTAFIRFFRGGTALSPDVAATPGQTVSYTDTGRTNGTTYTYTAKALDTSSNLSAASNTVSVTPLSFTPTELVAIAEAVRALLASNPVPTSTTIPTPPSAADVADELLARDEMRALLLDTGKAIVSNSGVVYKDGSNTTIGTRTKSVSGTTTTIGEVVLV